MKRTTIIWLIVLAYILCGVGLYFGTESFLDKKMNRLRAEAQNNLEHFFARQNKFVSVGYSGKKVAYEQISVPKYEAKAFTLNPNEDKEQWKETWGDIYKLYKLKPKYTSDKEWDSDRQWSGWLLNIVEQVSYDCFRTYQVYPYRVGYRKQTYSWEYEYMPSVQSAVNEAFDFHTTNDKSSYSKYMTSGSGISEYDVKRAVENEYFNCFSYEDLVRYRGQEEADAYMRRIDWWKYGNDASFYKAKDQYEGDYGYMYNGYYKVYNYIAPVAYYQIKYNYNWDPRATDKKKILIWGYAFLTLLLLAAIIPLSVIEARKKKEKGMSLKEKLLHVCNPTQFMKPYDEKKVAAANDLYESIIAVPDDDIDALKSLRKRAAKELGVSFVDPDLLKELISIANPEKYTKPYNPEKVRIANQIYTRLVSDGLDVDEVEELQNEINEKLLNDNTDETES